MKNLKLFTALALIVALSSFAVSNTNPGNWRFIGDKIASFGPERDVLQITGNDNYRKIRIKVTGAPIFIYDMDIYFENGEKMNVPLQTRFRQGEDSRAIDLPGGVRNVKKITFLYDTKGFIKGKGRVAVWGMR